VRVKFLATAKKMKMVWGCTNVHPTMTEDSKFLFIENDRCDLFSKATKVCLVAGVFIWVAVICYGIYRLI
jgi:hypothetical protein